MPKAVVSCFMILCFATHINAECPQPEAASTLAQLVFTSAPHQSPDEKQAGDESQQGSVDEIAASRNLQRVAKLEKPLSEIRLNATDPEGDRPVNQAAELLVGQPESVIEVGGGLTFVPDRYTVPLCYRPLYFEELNLERCGNTYGCATNVVSAVHFLTNTAALPYRLATQRADGLIPTHGDCKTCQAFSHDIEPFGFETKGVLIEAAAIAGFIFLAM